MSDINSAVSAIVAAGQISATERDIVKRSLAAFVKSAVETHRAIEAGTSANQISLAVKDAVKAGQVLARDVYTSDVAVGYHALTGQALLIAGKLDADVSPRDVQYVIKNLGAKIARPIVENGSDVSAVYAALVKALKRKNADKADKATETSEDAETSETSDDKLPATVAELLASANNILTSALKRDDWSADDYATLSLLVKAMSVKSKSAVRAA